MPGHSHPRTYLPCPWPLPLQEMLESRLGSNHHASGSGGGAGGLGSPSASPGRHVLHSTASGIHPRPQQQHQHNQHNQPDMSAIPSAPGSMHADMSSMAPSQVATAAALALLAPAAPLPSRHGRNSAGGTPPGMPSGNATMVRVG